MKLHYIYTFSTKNGPNSNKVGKGHNLPLMMPKMDSKLQFSMQQTHIFHEGVAYLDWGACFQWL